jgi:HSP20 family molecular chaperone IbpA
MSTVSLWARRDPFTDFDVLVRSAFGADVRGTRTAFTPAAEVARDGDDAVVRLELPGLELGRDVTVEVDRGRLVVRGERRDERTEEANGRTLREVRYGSFYRAFELPAHVDSDAIAASYDAGVLTVRIAGAHVGGHARRIEVTSGQQPKTEPIES